MEVSPHQSRIGQILSGRYELIRLLGMGATGVVYLAKDRELGEVLVAVKLLYPHLLSNAKSLERFRSEVRIVRELSHPNIVKIYSLERDSEGNYFLVMEYVDGVSLEELLHKNPEHGLPLEVTSLTLYELASGVAHAHEHGIIHRDLKPQNILVCPDGSVKVCDFGVARQLGSDNALTKTGDSVGTPYYMAPEIFRGKEIDERTDVYAIGIIAYELLTGLRPFEDEAFYALALKHMESPLPSIPEALYIPQWLSDFVQKAAAKNPDERYASAKAIAEIFETHLDPGMKAKCFEYIRNWTERERRRIALERKKKAKRLLLALALIGVNAIVILAIVARLSGRQQWVLATPLLRWERDYGAIVKPIKWLFAVNYSLSEEEMRDLVLAVHSDENFTSIREKEALVYRIRSLLNAGIDPNLRDDTSRPLVMYPIQRQWEDLVMLFIEAPGFDPNLRNLDGQPILHLAINSGMRKVSNELLSRPNVDPNSIDSRGDTVLHLAARLRDPVLMGTLQLQSDRRNFRTDLQNQEGYTPLGLALNDRNYPSETLRLLVKISDVNAPSANGRTPLVIAAQVGNAEIIHALLARGADPSRRDSEGHTPLYYASRLSDSKTLLAFVVRAFEPIHRLLLDEVDERFKAEFMRALERSKVLAAETANPND